MPLWIVASVFAAFMQNLRFLLQRHLKVTTLSTGGATWARFAFAVPFVALALILYRGVSGQAMPGIGPGYWAFVVTGALAQMCATACVVALFARRNFYVGITLKKSEVILTAFVGLVVLGEAVSLPVLVAIAIGFAGVLALSDPPKEDGLPWTKRVFNAASGYGLASGLLFGVSAVCYRGATLALEGGDAPLRACVALLTATLVQSLSLGLWLALREPGQIGKVFAAWRVALPMGLTSMLGSTGWFIAFALQTAAYVKAVGQVELVFTFLFSAFWLKEKTSRNEVIGIALVVVSLAMILWAGLGA
ncbi:DMT family transporter [Hasllibacter sp. MH4015]|uniref:DMT family transporter n=1 Tax=Hasllibacter sp. MH4015 TaxID=2854029 RepID=UPI001CD521CC|nr:DMT family transporter [Hasllibacter sp. MH4015]